GSGSRRPGPRGNTNRAPRRSSGRPELWSNRGTPEPRNPGTNSEQLLKSLIPRPAHGQLRAVRQNRETAVLRVQLDSRQALDVQQVRPVDPDEAARVQLCLQ